MNRASSRGAVPKKATAKKAKSERKDDAGDDADFILPETQVIVPEDQIKLTQKEMDEEVVRVITANDPHVPTNVVVYSFVDHEYKATAGEPYEHTAVHFSRTGAVLHNDSEAAAEQKAWEKAYKADVEDAKREKLRVASEEGRELTDLDLEEDIQRNQFNFTERSAQSINSTIKTRVVSTTPLEVSEARGYMTQWSMYDAYVTEYERLVAAANAENKKAAPAKAAASSAAGGDDNDPMHSAAMSHALKIVERMVTQNAEDEVFIDYKYWEDASDRFRDTLGSCLPLWKFDDARTKRKMVTGVCWNPRYPDMFAVSYGSYEYMKQGSGAISIFTLKNVGHPEHLLTCESGVMCMDWHPEHPSLLVVGCYDGNVKIFDVRRKDHKPVFTSDVRSGKHADPVWEIKWCPANATLPGGGGDSGSRDLAFFTVSTDGRICTWAAAKSELKMEPLMTLRLVKKATAPSVGSKTIGEAALGDTGASADLADASATAASTASASASASATAVDEDGEGAAEGGVGDLAGGCCFAFNPFNGNMFLVGTEEGLIHQCALDNVGAYQATYEGHHMAVYSLKWNHYHPRVFLSCSADWTVKLWDHSYPKAIMSFDLGTSVGHIAWAPYSSTTFSAVTDEGKVVLYDLHANKHDPVCDQKVVKRVRCTHVAFSDRAPILLVGDTHGSVTSLKLSPNLRKITEIPIPPVKKGEAPVPPPPRDEVEVRKMDRLLALSDAKITIVTPIPGQQGKKKGEGAAAPAAAAAEPAAE